MAEAMSASLSRKTADVRASIDELRVRNPEAAAQIEALAWIKDGVQLAIEPRAVNGLIALADAGHLAKVIDEPWVIEGRNYPALLNLGAKNISFDPPEFFEWYIHHPALNDGITYRESKIIASVGTQDDASRFDPESPHTIEERTITLPLAGKVELTIIRTDPALGYDNMMDDLEHAIRGHEEFMDLPFPQRQVVYVVAPGAGGNWAANFVWLGDDPGYTLIDQHIIAHVAAYYYWGRPRGPWAPYSPGSTTWVSGGAARLLGYGPEAAREELTEVLENSNCAGLTIRELESSNPQGSKVGCSYPVGEAFYRDLYRAMDPTNFRLAFRRWLIHGMVDVLGDVCARARWWAAPPTTYCHVMEAFTTYASDDNRVAVEDVINRWYGGPPLPDASIRGVVTGPDGEPARDIEVGVFWGRFHPVQDGTFDLLVPSGSHKIQIVWSGDDQWFFVGWHDGGGGITIDPNQAFEVVVEDIDVEGVEIVVPADIDSLLCPPGQWRSTYDGQCYVSDAADLAAN